MNGPSKPAEYEQISDLLDAYFEALKLYNLALGAFDMRPQEILDARRREALSYARVRQLRAALIARGVAV